MFDFAYGLFGLLTVSAPPLADPSPVIHARPVDEAPPATSSSVEAAPTTATSNTSPESAEGPQYRTVVVHDAPQNAEQRRAQLRHKTPGFASVIDAAEHRDAHSQALPDIAKKLPGAAVRSIGGLGQFSAMSLRGSSAQQVRIFLDDVPLDGGFSGLGDLSQSNIEQLDSLEIYRGYIPIAYGGATIGGAVVLQSRIHPIGSNATQSAALGVGSFGARNLSLRLGGNVGAQQSLAIDAAYSGADGDYSYFDDRGTPFNTDDDATLTRQNNGYSRFSTHVAHARRTEFWDLKNHFRLSRENLQIPGSGRVQSTRARQDSWQLRMQTRAQRRLAKAGQHLRIVGGIAGETRHFVDPQGEVGVGRDDERGHSLDAYASLQLRLALWPFAFLGIAADERLEEVIIDLRKEASPDAIVPTPGDALRTRWSQGASIQLQQFALQGKALIQPALRIDWVQSWFEIPEHAGELSDEGRDHQQWGFSPRLGGRAELLSGLELRSSVGRYVRFPTLMELFGDRGYIVGNEGLKAERGLSTDAGFWFHHSKQQHIEVASAFFAAWSDDLIQWQRGGAHVRAENLRSARVHGIESELHGEFFSHTLRFDASHTWLHSTNQSREAEQRGKSLPGRPEHQIFAALQAGKLKPDPTTGFRFAAQLNYDFIAGNFLDPSGRYELPPRQLWGIGGSLSYRGWSLHAALQNLMDMRTADIQAVAGPPRSYPAPISDFLGYPLPGRSVWVSLRFDAFSSPARDSSKK